MAFLAQILGGIIPIIILSLIVRFAWKKFFDGIALIFACVATAFVFGGVIGSYGMADGGPPAYAKAFATYLFPAVIVLALWIVGYLRGKKASNRDNEIRD